MSGIEAIYWAQTYPDEVEAMIGLDMAVPKYYGHMKINIPMLKLGQYAANIGITRIGKECIEEYGRFGEHYTKLTGIHERKEI